MSSKFLWGPSFLQSIFFFLLLNKYKLCVMTIGISILFYIIITYLSFMINIQLKMDAVDRLEVSFQD